MTNVACIAERSVCALRATRLGDDCAPLTGSTDGAVAVAVATINVTSDVEEGTKFEPKDGCGRTVYTAEDPDTIKRKTLSIELINVDFEFMELVTDATLILGASGGPYENLVIGIEEPGATTPHKNGIALEVWTKTAFGTGACGEDGANPNWLRHLFPRVFLRPGDRTMENAPANLTLAGTSNSNPQWTDVWGDFPGVEGDLSGLSPHLRFFDPDGPPDSACGYLTPGAGS